MSELKPIDPELIINKIIDVTETNLATQGDFLKAIYELKTRLDGADRDHRETRDDVKFIRDTCNEILTKMKTAPNERIIELVQELIDQTDSLGDIKEKIQDLREDCKDKEGYSSTLKTLADNVKGISNSWTILKWLIAAIVGILTLGMTVIGIMQKNELSEMKQQIQKQIEQGFHNADTNTTE